MKTHLQRFEEKIEETRELKYKVQEQMTENQKSEEEVTQWSAGLEEGIAKTVTTSEVIKRAVAKFKDEAENYTRYLQDKEEEKRMQQRLEEERRIQEMKTEMKKLKKTEKRRGSREDDIRVKIPKLVITQFEGINLAWFRFWYQYETQIDKSSLSPIFKLSYLKELLAPKARVLTDGLPFTTEGYERAKVILKSRFGKPSEVAKAHIENVISLPVINNSNPGRIHSFYEKLVTSVQSLESMGKLQNINLFVRHTLDKLSGIKSELVRSDDDWQEWTYVELVEALKKWTERNPLQSTEKSSENNPKKEV